MFGLIKAAIIKDERGHVLYSQQNFSIYSELHLHGFYCLLAAGLFRLTGFRTATRLALMMAVCLPVIYGFLWIGHQLLRPLEDIARPPEQAELAAADGVIACWFYRQACGECRTK